ncbi:MULTISPECIES: GNAT family N-acetyltransferase [Haloferacaceae]|uniref:GNAT family N-acetyltransferase n=1 Tax=Halorubrum glutamatedens TaxID=2707018 RepID=A0ABD5QMG1_9EURY|nr:GNAT family N-acetyltransferase [Halobellus captivus]
MSDRSPPDGVGVETATPDDRLDVLRVLDAAMLETDADGLIDRIDAGDVLVARFERTGSVVGALVTTRPEPGRRHVDAVAVRRARRGRGIGSALVAGAVRAAESDPETDRVTAAFDAELEAFYVDLGFVIESTGDDDGGTRISGRREVGASTGGKD